MSRTNIIRTSDRKTFKKCRQQWDFTSKIRQNWEPNTEAKALSFGTAIHAALETYYNPATWTVEKSSIEPIALAAFAESLPKPVDSSDLEWAEYQTSLKLGKDMLIGYFKFYSRDDFTPMHVEVEFEVPVVVPVNSYGLPDIPPGFTINDKNELLHDHEPVMYQGRIDMIVKDKFDRYWIWDHKTAASLSTTDHLELDEQCGSYMWAIYQMLGIQIQGVIYNELVKKIPHKPKVLKKGNLSIDKKQDTTYELFMEAIRENGFTVDQYAEFLQFLKDEPKLFFRRTQVDRSSSELEVLGNNIAFEALDMLDSPRIYMNPNKMNCNYCSFKAPCMSKMEGGNVQWMLKESFHTRSESEIVSAAEVETA